MDLFMGCRIAGDGPVPFASGAPPAPAPASQSQTSRELRGSDPVPRRSHRAEQRCRAPRQKVRQIYPCSNTQDLTSTFAMAVPKRELYINGRWVRPVAGKTLPIVNPATEEIVGSIPAGGPADIDLAVEAASLAFKSGTWSKSSGAHRAKFLRAIAERITARKADLARLETIDQGKPIAEAEGDIDDVIACFEYYAGLAEGIDGKQDAPIDVGMDDFKSRVRREPMGVVGLITPWNYPMLMAAWKVAPALAAGNTAVLKPSELASVTCLELAAIAHDVGLPPGVFNVVTGTGVDAGAPLSSHPGLSKVAFTGSTATGRQIAISAAKNLIPHSNELGGKSAILVFEDADLKNAVEWVMFGQFFNSGQVCSATSRLLVHEKIASQFLAMLKERAESIRICDPLDPNCRQGAVVSAGQYAKILDFIKEAQREGATLLTGGRRPSNLTRGFYLMPTIFTNVMRNMRVWREEVFGPVLAVATFRTEEEAVSIANDTPYGLAAAVVSSCQQRCERVAQAMEVGIVWINCSQPTFVQAPWGGIKASGYGRELGPWGLDNFTSIKQITSYVSSKVWDWYPASTSKL